MGGTGGTLFSMVSFDPAYEIARWPLTPGAVSPFTHTGVPGGGGGGGGRGECVGLDVCVGIAVGVDSGIRAAIEGNDKGI